MALQMGALFFPGTKESKIQNVNYLKKNSKVYRAPFVDKNAAVLNALAYA